MDMFGVFDFIIILFVLLWRIGLPIVLAYVLLRVWRRLRTIEQTLDTIRAELAQKA